VSRLAAGVWTSAPLPAPARLRGIGGVRLEVRRQAAGTVVAYLYDVDALGTGRLIAHEPATWTAGASTLDLRLPATSYDVPARHRLALVVDTVDPLYLDHGPVGRPLAFTGRSWLDLPVR
jgi:hypothetical protein